MILKSADAAHGPGVTTLRGSKGPGCRAIPRPTLLSSETQGPQRSSEEEPMEGWKDACRPPAFGAARA